jgi:Ca2+-binding EF-hand superfamily protein
MRENMNNLIEDEHGLMSIQDFRKMFFNAMANGGRNKEKTQTIYLMLLPIIIKSSESNESPKFVSIDQLSKFIDFFNYVPFMFKMIKHKNMQTANMYTFMGQKEDSLHLSDDPEEHKSVKKSE